MGEHLVGHCLPGLADRVNRALQVDRVPEHNCGDHKVQSTSAMPLILVRAIPQFSQTVEKHRSGQSVLRLSLVESGMNAPPQFDAADVLEQE